MGQTLDKNEMHYVFASKIKYTMGFCMWTTIVWNVLFQQIPVFEQIC